VTAEDAPPSRPLPRMWRAAGALLRGLGHFEGRWRFLDPALGPLLRGRGYTTVARFDRGQRIRLDLDDWISYQIFLTGYYDVETAHTRFFRRLVREGMVVVDVGANIGYYTLQAAVRVGPSGSVHAFEPVAEIHERLLENVRLNGLGNVVVNRRAVQDRPGTVEVFVGDRTNRGTSGPVAPPNPAGRQQVEAVTLDAYAEATGLAAVDVVKIDVEGSEAEVLKGMSRLLAREEIQLLVEISDRTQRARGSSASELIGDLRRQGFEPWRITRRGLRPLLEPVVKESLVLFRRPRSPHP
jgi:FkbM family methyltransferase